ncbi:TetR family transcriptional regulator [Bordetella genomosp. 1]|uniref:TetR family transcriptional regulator n=1 Tax=Bordetella genomosp. 1 TaxID=1395607 RepID=A0A261S7E7_9BORD|nr:TetR family transcriptional regulator [Bordetella genomosp. 1]
MVDRAITLFAQKGFALTTRELAAGLNVTQPLLYRYFPSKQLLIEKVYERVFLSRWDPAWERMLADRSVPLRQRLVSYLTDYTRAILHGEWVRIFLYAGLQDPTLNQRYLKLLHERVFALIIKELRHHNGETGRLGTRQRMLDTEVLWGFHSSFFYMGVRKWVYQLPVPDDLDEVIGHRVDAFLNGVSRGKGAAAE